MNKEIEKAEVKKILHNLEYVSDIHKVFIEDGYRVAEEIPSSQIKELRLNSYSAKLLFNYINNLQSKIDKINQYIKEAKESDSCTILPSGKISDVGYCIDALEDIEDILKEDK